MSTESKKKKKKLKLCDFVFLLCSDRQADCCYGLWSSFLTDWASERLNATWFLFPFMVLCGKMLTVLANSKQTDIPSRIVSHRESLTCFELSSGEGINQEGFGVTFIPHDSLLQTKAVREEDGRKARKQKRAKKKKSVTKDVSCSQI